MRAAIPDGGPCRPGVGLRLLAASVAAAVLGSRPCAAVRLADDPKLDSHNLRCLPYSVSNAHQYVTAIVSTSPRREDAKGLGLQVLKDTVRSIRDVLGLKGAQIVVAFDALPSMNSTGGLQAVPDWAAYRYTQKLADFKAWNREELGGAVTVYENSEWTHQAEMLHRLFELLAAQGTLKPMVFLAQDDSPVSGVIDVPFILHTLGCDPSVDYVRFLWSQDCTEGLAPHWNGPCEQHPRTPFLHNVSRMSDRPHFATTTFYFEQVFSKCPRTYRGVPERAVLHVRRAWIYGRRHEMQHETNALQNSYNELPGSYDKGKSKRR